MWGALRRRCGPPDPCKLCCLWSTFLTWGLYCKRYVIIQSWLIKRGRRLLWVALEIVYIQVHLTTCSNIARLTYITCEWVFCLYFSHKILQESGCEVCMFSVCMCCFSSWTAASSHYLKTYKLHIRLIGLCFCLGTRTGFTLQRNHCDWLK